MPTYMLTGTVPVAVEAVTNWDSSYIDYRNGEIRFDAKNVEGARRYVALQLYGNKLNSVHALYLVRRDSVTLIPLKTKRERRALLHALELIFEEEKSPLLKELSDGELERLLGIVRHQVWDSFREYQKRQEKIEAIVKLLKPAPKRRKLAIAYLKEFSDDMLEHIHTHVLLWKQEKRGKMFISASLSDNLRPAVSKELFGI